MKGVVKLEALRSLGAYIAEQIPELRKVGDVNPIKYVQTPPDQRLRFPTLAIVGTRYRADYGDEDVTATPTKHSAVICLGAWQTRIQLRLACATEASRYELEDRLTDLFFQRENAPGVLLTQVTACPHLGDDILAAWDLQEADWEEEYAFSSQEWSVLEVLGTVPMLALRDNVYTIDELRFGLTSDFNIPATSAGFDTVPGLVQVNADGTITPL